MLVGAGGNIAVQIGDEGVLVADTGTAQMSEKVLAAIRKLSDKPIRYSQYAFPPGPYRRELDDMARRGVRRGAAPPKYVAHENVPEPDERAGRQKVADADRGVAENTFFPEEKDFFFNDEAVMLYHDQAAHTDGDSIIFFRRSDVVVAGDIFITTGYPVIDASEWRHRLGVIDGLNRILDLTVPKQAGRRDPTSSRATANLCDESEVLEYRDMVVIIKDRIEDMVKRGDDAWNR